MSVSIGFKPLHPMYVEWVSGGSHFLSVLKEACNDCTVLNREDIGALRAMAACGYEGAEELIEAINKHGSIQLVVQY